MVRVVVQGMERNEIEILYIRGMGGWICIDGGGLNGRQH